MIDGDWVESKDQDPNGSVRLIQLADVGSGVFLDKSNRWLTSERAVKLRCTFLETGDLLISRLGDPLGKACLFPSLESECVTVVDVHVFRAGSSEISHKWLMHALNSHSVRTEIESKSSGTTRKRITGQKLKDLEIPLPPAPEQQRIASRIEELFSSIEDGERALQRVLKLVDRYRQSVLMAAVTGKLTRAWREKHAGESESGETLLAHTLEARRNAWRESELDKMTAKGLRPIDDRWQRKYKEPGQPDTAGLPTLPDRWVWTSLPTLCATGTTSGISVKGSNVPPGVPALRLDAMTASGFDYTAIRYIPISEETANRLKIAGGDFFISRANGSLRLVGRAVLANEPRQLVVFPDTMIRYRLLRVPDFRRWLSTVWQSQLLRAQIEKRAKTTAGIHKISQEDISMLAIPLPPLEEQAVICSMVEERFGQAEHALLETLSTQKLATASKQAILKTAFLGQLVPQDPSDEHASILLKRIATERSALPKRAATKLARGRGVKA